MRKILVVISIVLTCITGCTIPEKIKQDVATIRAEEQKLYDFNQKLIKIIKATNAEQLQKKVDLLTISRVAHHRVKTATQLLAEYLGSTEYFTDQDLTLGENLFEMIRQVKQKFNEG